MPVHGIYLLCLISFAFAHDAIRTPLCKQAEDLYRSLCYQTIPLNHEDLEVTQGLPGKRGPKGEIGETGRRGEQGIPGVVDYGKVENITEAKVKLILNQQNERMTEMVNRMDKLATSLSRAEQKITQLETKQGICHMKFENFCFWVERRTELINYQEGEQLCSGRGGYPANIYSKMHYEMITSYLRTQIWANEDIIYVWLGLKYNISTKETTLSDGSPAPYLQWHPGFPKPYANNVYIGMHVRVPWNLLGRDMYNHPTIAKRQGVLCQK
uniref:pulmonary surfactant-associated protein A-like n=1 Tax=Styela clava TaxID=7725 RepID=UPI001939D874|nr:pulmonary surfactant-associated protein A-like [Styela clava]